MPTGDVDRRGCNDVDVVFAHCLGVVLREGVFKRLGSSVVAANALLEHLAGHLARTEPWDTHFPCDLLECFADRSVEGVLVDLDRQLHFRPGGSAGG